MFANIQSKGVEMVMRLVEHETAKEAAHELDCLADSKAARGAALRAIDTGGDGKISAAEIMALANNRESPLAEFIDFVRREMALGEGDENLDQIVVNIDDL